MKTLYKMTHNKTGLLYLGYTTKDLSDYDGSGKHWKRHLKKHGCDISKEIIFQSDIDELFELVCLEYSDKYDIVNSKAWANLIPEDGSTGAPRGVGRSQECRDKIAKTLADGASHFCHEKFAFKGKDNPAFKGFIEATCRTTGEVKLFEGPVSLREAGFTHPCNVYSCIAGRIKSYKNHTFKRLEVENA